MSKHTPGPWTQFDDGSQSEVLDRIVGPIKNVRSHMTATVARASFGIRSNEEVAANARLISAAPDLLAALEDMVRRGGSSEDEWCPRECLDAARNAITKATGN